jgi:hypothetical protein
MVKSYASARGVASGEFGTLRRRKNFLHATARFAHNQALSESNL